MLKLTDTFITVDQNGTQHKMYEYQEFQTVTYINGRTAESPGTIEYWCDGHQVTLLRDGTFKLADGKTQVNKVANQSQSHQ